MRWVWRAESGAGAIEYGALLVLAGALAAALVLAGIPSTLTTAVSNAVCELYTADHCEDTGNGPGTADDTNGDGGNGGENGGNGGEGGDGPGRTEQANTDGSGDGDGGEDGQGGEDGADDGVPTELDSELEDAQKDYDDLLKEQEKEQGAYDNLDEELMGLLEELIGLADAKKCFLEGDIQACLWTALNAIPWSKALKFVSKIPKAYKLFDKWRKGSKALDKINERVRRQKEKLDDLKRKKAEQDKNKKEPSCPVGGKPNSFVPDTPVLLADGTRAPIQDIDIGDRVWAFDPATGTEGPRAVTDLITGTGTKTLITLTITTGDGGGRARITATGEHPFWQPDQATWTDAADLEAGDELRTASGTWATVVQTTTRTVPDQPVHNLTIAGLHTYYAAAGAVPLLTHNDNKNEPCAGKVTVDDRQFGKKWGKHAEDYGLDPADPTARKWFKDKIQKTVTSPDETRQGPYRPGQGGADDYIFYRQGKDLVITKNNGEFVTMFPISGSNRWFDQATPVG